MESAASRNVCTKYAAQNVPEGTLLGFVDSFLPVGQFFRAAQRPA
jgi:hypothetical protein